MINNYLKNGSVNAKGTPRTESESMMRSQDKLNNKKARSKSHGQLYK